MTFIPKRVIYDHAAGDKSPKAEREKTMTRAERNDYNSTKSFLKKNGAQNVISAAIRKSGSHEYKQAMHELFTSYDFLPVDISNWKLGFMGRYDEEMIQYTRDISRKFWTEHYSPEARAEFEAALA